MADMEVTDSQGGNSESTMESGAKRKASSPLGNTTLKRQNSLPDLKSSSSKKPVTFTEMMLKSLNDDGCAKDLAPALINMVSPAIQKCMETVVDRAVQKIQTSVDTLLESNNELKAIVVSQSKIIETQGKLIDEQKVKLNANSDKIDNLEKDMTQIKSELSQLKLHVNNLEQYGRRNSVRLINFKFNKEASELRHIESAVNFINSKVLPDDEEISETDIERCHPIGTKQLIVKFSSYHTKQKVFRSKSALKQNPDKVFITEDLTKANHAVVRSLISMRKSRQIDSFWTKNGVIYAKKRAEDTPVKLSCDDDLDAKLA